MRLYCTAFKLSDQLVCNLDVLHPDEHSLIRSFQSLTGEHSPADPNTAVESFENHCRLCPRKVAITCEDITWTYAQLHIAASNIAGELLSNIGGRILKERAVIILMDKNEYAIASVLGVWKASGHFLPIAISNQSSLKDVLTHMTPASIVINTSRDQLPVLDKLSSTITCPIIDIRNIPMADYYSKYIQADQSADDVAYIIRTSGSSGRQKQCSILQRSILILSNAWKNCYNLDAFEVIALQWAPLSFDVFVGDLVRALICVPGTLAVCPEKHRLDIQHVLNLISTNRVSISEVTPQFGLQMALLTSKKQLESIQLLVLGSDILQTHVYQKVRAVLHSDQRLVNSYGMTEATIDSSFFEGDILPMTRSGAVPIGKPLPGVTYHILDSETLQVCPVGTPGELYISGDILAGGDVEIISLKHTEGRALKTGDAACWLPCGNVDLLGRLDSMVKLRGFRISTSEIANKIVEHVSGVQDATCVVLKGDSKEAEFLCAFLVLKEGIDPATVDRNCVRCQLINHLPHYMLPDFVQTIEEIPLTANGKINFAALPSLSQLQSNNNMSTNSSSSMVTSTGRKLKSLFAASMGLPNSENINCDLTFMEQGANSLILIQFSTLIATHTIYNVTIADIFSYRTINILADYIDNILYKSVSYSPLKHTICPPDPESVVTIPKPAQIFSQSPHHPQMKTLLMFPGHRAQKKEMLWTMKNSPEAKAIFQRAEAILGYNILDLCTVEGGQDARLKSTEFVEVALFTGCIAKMEQIKKDRPDLIEQITHVAGLSVGEFSALVFAGVIKFEDALRVVQCRGKVMESEVNNSATGMVSIFGPNSMQLQDYLTEHFPNMKISIFLGDDQHTVAGTSEDCKHLMQSLSENKEDLNIIDVRKLRVAGAFHSSHMMNAAAKVNPFIQSLQFSEPSLPVIMNVNGTVTLLPEDIKQSLQEQITAPVMWKKSMTTAYASGIEHFIEVAPCCVLSSIVKKRISEYANCEVKFIEM